MNNKYFGIFFRSIIYVSFLRDGLRIPLLFHAGIGLPNPSGGSSSSSSSCVGTSGRVSLSVSNLVSIVLSLEYVLLLGVDSDNTFVVYLSIYV